MVKISRSIIVCLVHQPSPHHQIYNFISWWYKHRRQTVHKRINASTSTYIIFRKMFVFVSICAKFNERQFFLLLLTWLNHATLSVAPGLKKSGGNKGILLCIVVLYCRRLRSKHNTYTAIEFVGIESTVCSRSSMSARNRWL